MTVAEKGGKVYSVQESAARFDQSTRVDRAAKVVRDVVVLGHKSDNRRIYTQAAMESALPLYEGAAVKIDHPELDKARDPRPFDTTWGWLKNARVVMEEGAPKIRADLHYLETHPNTLTILERIESHPDKLGLSHNADVDGDWADGGSVFNVAAITEVRSVDLVENPATTRGIFESRDPNGDRPVATATKRKMKLRGILEGADYLPGKAASISGKAVVEMMDQSEEWSEVLDLEMEMADAGSPEDGVSAGIEMAIIAVVKDSELDAKGKLDKIKKLLGILDPAESTAVATEEENEEAVTEPATESKGRPHSGGSVPSVLEKRLAALESKLAKSEQERELAVLESRCREMLDKGGVEALESRVGAMVRCPSDADRLALMKEFPKRADTNRPERSPSITALESAQDFSSVKFGDPKSVADALR